MHFTINKKLFFGFKINKRANTDMPIFNYGKLPIVCFTKIDSKALSKVTVKGIPALIISLQPKIF